MISSSTISQVKELPIEEVVGQYVTLTKNKALSPFTEEKTPSFNVHPTKNIFKCFSTGKGGDGINFIMELKQLTFQEAIIQIAQDHNITIEYENISPAQQSKNKENQEQKVKTKTLLSWANTQWGFNELPKTWKSSRKFSDQILEKFEVSFSGK